MSTYIRTWTVLVRVNTGPPTWWKPDFEIHHDKIWHVRFGWLRMAVQIGFGTKRALEAEMESSLLPPEERAFVRDVHERYDLALAERRENKPRSMRMGVEIVKDIDKFTKHPGGADKPVSAAARASLREIRYLVGTNIFEIQGLKRENV